MTMQLPIRALSWAGLISLVISLASCSNSLQNNSPIPDTGPTISEVYEKHMTKEPLSTNTRRKLHDGSAGLEGYTREVFNELSVRFPRLPNPTIIMYIFPHLSLEGTPVPGYSTMFQLYTSTQYALPGELQN